jgi:hypothetical protein
MMSGASRRPQIARVSILTPRQIEAGLDPAERERRCERLRERIADLIDAAKWNAEPLP